MVQVSGNVNHMLPFPLSHMVSEVGGCFSRGWFLYLATNWNLWKMWFDIKSFLQSLVVTPLLRKKVIFVHLQSDVGAWGIPIHTVSLQSSDHYLKRFVTMKLWVLRKWRKTAAPLSRSLIRNQSQFNPDQIRINNPTVHVTSYLNFSAEIRGFSSRNSVNLRKIFCRASAPALQTGRRNVLTVEHFPRNTVVSRRRRDRFQPPSESSLATRD